MLTRCLVLVAALLLSACDAVYTHEPPGDAADIRGREERWAGVWFCPDGFTITVKVIDASRGVLKVGWIQEQGKDLQYRSVDVYLREYADWSFASARLQEPDEKDIFVWGRITKPAADEQVEKLVLWRPDAKAFARRVKEGSLAGKVDSTDYSTIVLLETLSGKDMDMITGADQNLFRWDRPIVLIHLSSNIEKWM